MTRLTLLLILALSAQVHAQSRKLVIADSPKSATVEGYERGHCVALRNRIRVCKVLSEPEFIYPNGDDNGPFVDRYLGDAATGKIYPAHYLPSDPRKWLTGRRATLRTYKENKTEVLWLEPQRGNK